MIIDTRIKTIADSYTAPRRAKRVPPHDLSAMTNQIDKEIGFTKKYSRGYWLNLLKKAKMTDPKFQGILKEVRNMPRKYNRGGRLTNVLKDWLLKK